MNDRPIPLAGATAAPRLDLPAPNPAWALFLDLDGTLVEVAPSPDQVVVRPEMLQALARSYTVLNGAVALVSGRSIADLDRLLDPLRLPTAGLHGLEQRLNSTVTQTPSPAGLAAAQAALAAVRPKIDGFAAENDGVTVEDKGLTIALHYRAAPAMADAARRLVRGQINAHADTLHCVDGKMVLEIKPKGTSKGSAVEAFMASPPFAGRLPVFVGDDRTDEDGFAAVNHLAGVSIRVGPTPPDLPASQAHWQCAGVAELVAWLAALSDELEQT